MGCNTSQEKLSASNIDVQDNIKSSGVTKNGKVLKSKELKNSCKSENELLVEEMEEFGQDEDSAATKIQAAFRGHQTRTAMKKSDIEVCSKTKTAPSSVKPAAATTGGGGGGAAAAVAANNAEPEPTKEELEAEFDPNDKELCDAAMKIQATFRGHLQRKIGAGGDKDDVDVDIQEITKKVAEELDIDLTDPELNKAATKIQASFRGHKTRKQ